MVSRKRGRQEMETPEPPKEPTMLERIRDMWEFANLSQWIFTFGRAVKIDENLDIEDLEMECLKSYSTVLPDIGLALLKFVSSHRGLTPEIFDEYTRRQYVAKAPLRNPYGEEEDPANFNDFDVFTKIRVLQQLTQWTFGNPDRIRERMEEQKDTEQTIWRIEPFGWDSEDRTYIVLDDNRLYRRTDPPPPAPPAAKPKKNSKKGKAAARRASKRRKVSEPAESEAEVDEAVDEIDKDNEATEGDGFGGMKWECIAVTLNEFNNFLASIEKSRDPNEKILRKRIADDVLPLLEKQEEARQRKQAQKERELLNLEKLSHAKRSSRIAGKMEQQKQEEDTREAERKKHAELVMAKKEQEKWVKLEKERESRMMTREQRLKEREARRILHEEELANLSEDNKKLEAGESRLSERHLKAEIERKKQALEKLAEEDDWIFDCICGAYGQIDDGTHSIACDKCNIWQHSKCVGVSEADADKDDFHFICMTCQRRAKDAERAKTQPPIKIKINRPGSSSSPGPPKQNVVAPAVVLSTNGGSKIEFSPQKQISYANSPPSGSKGPNLSMWPTQISSPQPHQPSQQYKSPGMYPPPQSNGHRSPLQGPYDLPRPSSIPNSYSGPYGNSSNMISHSPAKPVYTGPYAATSQASSPAPSVNGTPKPTSSHVFSKPQPYSPTSLPPPGMPLVHTFTNGNNHIEPAQVANTSSAQDRHHQQDTTKTTHFQSSPSALPRIEFGALPTHASNGSRPSTSDSGHRGSSLNQLSALAGTPNTNLVSKEPASSDAAFFSSAVITTPGPASISPPAFAYQTPLQDHKDLGHTSALPAVTTGYSPTKHSPPRPTSSNGSFGLATPSMLPPVASLSPSPSFQNLTPPVKHSDVERSRPAGQSVGP